MTTLQVSNSLIVKRTLGSRLLQIASLLAVIVLFALSLQSLWTDRLASSDADALALLFLVAAVLYRGSSTLWWAVLVPISACALFAPTAALELRGSVALGQLLREALTPVLSILAGLVVTTLRQTRTLAGEAHVELTTLNQKSRALAGDVIGMQRDLRQMLESFDSAFARAKKPQDPPATNAREEDAVELSTQEIASEPGLMSYHEASETLTQVEVREILEKALSETRQRLTGVATRVMFTAPTDMSLPAVVRGNRARFELALRSVLAQAVESIGQGNAGVVRVTLQPTLSSLVISVEDNGRGLGESHLARLIGAGREIPLTFQEVRTEMEKFGGQFEFQSRLGVGARVRLDLARVDGLARPERASVIRKAAPSVSLSSPS